MADYSEVSYEVLDQLLDIAEQPLHALEERHELSATLERWHWDEPEITLAWTEEGPYYVSKNVRFFIRFPYAMPPPNTGMSLLLATEANAWLDEDSETGEERVRRWEHRPGWQFWYDLVQLTQLIREGHREIQDAIDLGIQGSYEVADFLSLEDLSRTHYYRRTEL